METPTQKIARRFLSTGHAPSIDEGELTSACVQLILAESRKSFRRALTLSEKFASRAQKRGPGMRLMAFRALGQMNHMAGRHAEALAAYKRARRLARGDTRALAGMDRMLIDIYMYLGRYADARQAATRALKAYERLELTADWHKTRVNYANVLHRLDRHADAGRMYREAALFFEQASEPLATARCWYNLANTLVQLFEIPEAEKGYARAREIFEREAYALDACDVRYGQAWLKMLTGDLHIALLELDQCARIYRDAGNRRREVLCYLDLAEVSLGLGLYSDALDHARKAYRQSSRLSLRYEQAKAALFSGQAALSLGKNREASRAAQKARDGFGVERNSGFSGAVRLLSAALAGSDDQAASRRLQQARQLFRRTQLPLWEAVCDLTIAHKSARSDQALQRLAGNKAAQVVPHIYAGWQTILGDRYRASGQKTLALECWARAADRLDTVRCQLPPVELRGAYGRSQPSPHARLVAAEADSDPLRAAVWSERLRTAGVWAPIVADALSPLSRRRITDGLEALSTQVACLMHQLPGQQGERGAATAGANRSLHRLQRQLRLQFSEAETTSARRGEVDGGLDELIASTSRRLPIIQFHVAEDDIYGFVHQHGRTTLCTIRDGRRRVAYAMERWRFFMERQLFHTFPGRQISGQMEDSLWGELGNWLWRPLGVDPAADKVLVVADGELANLPWQAVSVDGRSLVEHYDITLAPSIRHFAAAERVTVDTPSVQLFRSDPGSLPNTEAEASVIRQLAAENLTEHFPSRRADWPTQGDSRVWHFAGHAVLRKDNPFYSYLLQSDGPLFAADFRMRRCRLDLATLAACRTGEQVAVPGDESTGLVRSLLEMGARNVIAGRWPVSDESTSQWMTEFYRRYLNNHGLFTAAREAALEVREKRPSAYHWAAFAVFGAAGTGGPDAAH